MKIDLEKPLYAKDNSTGKVHPVVGIDFCDNSLQLVGVAICVDDDVEWYTIDEIEFMPQSYIPDDKE